MKSIDEQILRSTKEIIVKFIEMGRLSPSNVHEAFKDVYATVDETVKSTYYLTVRPMTTKNETLASKDDTAGSRLILGVRTGLKKAGTDSSGC